MDWLFSSTDCIEREKDDGNESSSFCERRAGGGSDGRPACGVHHVRDLAKVGVSIAAYRDYDGLAVVVICRVHAVKTLPLN